MLAASVSFDLDPMGGRSFSLPGITPGTRSLLFQFEGKDGALLGAVAEEPAGKSFEPGHSYVGVILRFVPDPGDVSPVVRNGAPFVVWYGGEIGHGSLTR